MEIKWSDLKINEKLKRLRIEKDMTQRELAEKLGVSPSTIQKYEYGDYKIKYNIILKICDIFKISIDNFLNGSEEELSAFDLRRLRNNLLHKDISTPDFLSKKKTLYLKKNENINIEVGKILNEVIFDNTKLDFNKVENILKYILLSDFKINSDKKDDDIIEIIDKNEKKVIINYYDFIKAIEILYCNFDSLVSNIFENFDIKNSNIALKQHREKQKKENKIKTSDTEKETD